MPTTMTIGRSRPVRRATVLSLSIALLVTAIPSGEADGAAAHPITVSEPLPVLLQRGSAAFAAGDYGTAASVFAQVERDYGREEAWRSGTLPRRLLPLRGFAELRAGLPGDAAESLSAFLEQFPHETSQRSFVLYSLALALREIGRLDEALERFSAFADERADSAQAALARLQIAEILFQSGRANEALDVLQLLSGDVGVSEALRVQARLRALQKAVELHDDATAVRLLFHEPWAVTTMPEIAVLAFAAMEIGDRLLAERPEEAVRAYRFVLPHERLIEAQGQRLDELKTVFAERAPTVGAGAGSFWVDFYRGRIARLEAQLKGLIASDDYTVPLHMRVGQALLLAERFREAWLFFERIAVDGSVPEELRQPAHYRWILAAAGLAKWDDALAIARSFVEEYPDAEQAPDAFFLISRAHLEEGRYAEAEEVLTDLLTRFPGAPSRERTLFTRGWVRAMRETFELARDDFRQCVTEYPEGALRTNASLWLGLTHFFEREYPTALGILSDLANSRPGDPLYPEILYRRGTTLYAMRNFAAAREEMEQFIRGFATHPRHAEAQVLLGDILMGAGELAAARDAFLAVDPDAVNSFVYAAFQIGKILRAEGDYAGMVAHFTAYASASADARPRISEALYWVGWAEEQRGRPEAALPVYFDVIERHANDPDAGEVAATLSALERLVRRMAGAQRDGEADIRAANIIETGFDSWVDTRREQALADERFTEYARLTVFRAERHGAARQPYQEEALLLEVAANAPLESLDPTALARVGLALGEIGSGTAIDCFHRLLDRFPRSFQRAAAYFGLADRALKDGDFENAKAWLRRFENETPTHPLAPRASLLAAQALEEEGSLDAAIEAYEAVLRLKSARGRPHAEALFGLARCHEKSAAPGKAIAYHQRIYTMYRAYGDLVADAYMNSARLFEQLGDLAAATETYREFLSVEAGDAALRQTARLELERLETIPFSPAIGSTGES